MRKVIISAVLIAIATLTLEAQRTADVRVTNANLQMACVDGKPSTQRKWELPEREVAMTFTMRNRPRTGMPNADAGFAAIAFTPQPGHDYEIEVRSAAQMFSTRVWPKGEWRPVVRDRNTDQIVSGEPRWSDASGCP